MAGTPVKEGAGTVIAVVSGSGGCGKSTLSTMLALVAARSGLRAAAFDADFQFGDLDYLLGISSPLRVEEVVEDPSRLANTTSSDQAPFLIAAPRRLEVSELVTSHAVSIVSALKRAFDVVVVNTGSMWTDGHAGILEACDVVAFVTDSRPSSLRATVHAVELCARMGIATTGFTFVVNRHNKASLLSAVDVSCALRGSHAVELADGGRDVDELLGAGYPEELIESKNVFASGVRDLLIEMLPGHRSEVVKDGRRMPKRRRSLFGRGDGK
ncbi:MAG: P-loop NTPase [Slackia sp.]|nr:P-loop NTPase [Slackia sp.]